jgi:cell division protein FtsW (lipid II flippase)
VTRSRRNTELLGVLLALFVVGVAYWQVAYVILDELPSHFVVTSSIYAGLALAAHLALRFLARYADPVVLPIVVALNGLGLVMIYRLDLAYRAEAAAEGQPLPHWDSADQLTWTAIGVALFVLVLAIVRDHRVLQRFTYTALFVGLGLLLLPLVPGIGRTINGSRIWIGVGGLSFQPAEIAKLFLIIFFAGYLVVKRDALALARHRVLGVDLPRGRDLGPILLAWGVSLAVLVFEKDLGTSLLFFGLFVAMLYVATERRGWVVIGALLFFAGALVAYAAFDHVQTRVDIWLDPFSDPQDSGYQIVQSLFGMAAGGILGSGLGQGYPDFIPLANSDFIFAAFAEELGLTGVMALLLLYAILVERGMRTALRVTDSFGRLLATGLAFTLGFQVFVVIGGVTGLIPLTGLTTPFLSAGGSSLIANWVLIALLLRISDRARRPPPPPPPGRDEALTQVIQA